MHKEEKEKVFSAASKVEGVLQELGISTTTDLSNKYTPGQKMKYWCVLGGEGRWGRGGPEGDYDLARFSCSVDVPHALSVFWLDSINSNYLCRGGGEGGGDTVLACEQIYNVSGGGVGGRWERG